MAIKAALLARGAAQVWYLDAAECGCGDAGQTLVLSIWPYEASLPAEGESGWVHPYYPVSQQAYQMATQVVQEAQTRGLDIALRDDIRLKPILSRLPQVDRGRNTLNYLPEIGSRFHVQTMLWQEAKTADYPLLSAAKARHCGDCTACMAACPTGALQEDGFHRERCIRAWQMSGKLPPEDVRKAMGGTLLGCDICQGCCPHNKKPAPPKTECHLPIEPLLTGDSEAMAALATQIGHNIALKNRVLTQVCIAAGNSGNPAFLPLLEEKTKHPSPSVAEAAQWAMEQLLQVK